MSSRIPQYVQVTRNYSGSSAEQLSVVVGDLLGVLQDVNEHWWYCTAVDGKAGLVPKAYSKPFESKFSSSGTSSPKASTESAPVGLPSSSTAEPASKPAHVEQRSAAERTGGFEDSKPVQSPTAAGGASSRQSTANDATVLEKQTPSPAVVTSQPPTGKSNHESSTETGAGRPRENSPSRSPFPPAGRDERAVSRADREYYMKIIRDLQEQSIGSKSENEILQSRIQSLEGIVKSAEEDRMRSRALIREKNSLEEEVRYLRLQYEQSEADRADLRTRNENLALDLEEERRARENDRPEHSKSADAMRSQVHKLQEELRKLKDKNEELKNIVDNHRSVEIELENARFALERMKQENMDLRRQLNDRQHYNEPSASGDSAPVAISTPANPPNKVEVTAASGPSWGHDLEATVIHQATLLEEERGKNADLVREIEAIKKQIMVERSTSEVLSQELKVFHFKHSSIVKQMSLNRNSTNPAAEFKERKEYHSMAKDVESLVLDGKVNVEILAGFHMLNRARLFRDMLKANLQELHGYLDALRQEGLTVPHIHTTSVDLSKIDSPIVERIQFVMQLADSMDGSLHVARDHGAEAVVLWNKLHTEYSNRANVQGDAADAFRIRTPRKYGSFDTASIVSGDSSTSSSLSSFALPMQGYFSGSSYLKVGALTSLNISTPGSPVASDASQSSLLRPDSGDKKRPWK
eukprot:ANDGO_02104.mRNA.1 hypothetical protein